MKFAERKRSPARPAAATPCSANLRSARPAGARATVSADGRRPAGSPGGPRRPRVSDPTTGGSQDGSRPRQQRPSTTTYLKGQQIFAPGSGGGLVYIVRSGCVRLYKTLPDNRSINLSLLGPSTIFTQEDPADGLATGTTAEALVDSTLSVVESDGLANLIADSPELAAAFVVGMSRRLTELQLLIEQLLVRDTSVRLATTLLTLALRFGRPTADGLVAIGLPLTHHALANMIGSNRVTVTRKLLELQKKNAVHSLGRNAIAVHIDRLRDHAQGITEPAAVGPAAARRRGGAGPSSGRELEADDV